MTDMSAPAPRSLRLTIGLAATAFAAMLSFAAAGSSLHQPVTEADALPAFEILATVRAMGLNPISEPARRGPYYVLHAYDPGGIEVRVVADAQLGDIVSIAPARTLNAGYAPQYQRGPRIIHVPHAGARDDRASVNNSAAPAASGGDDKSMAVLPQPRPRRATVSVLPSAGELTPIRPTPRFKVKADGDQSAPPRDSVSSPPPPIGDLPPAAAPPPD